MSSVVVAWNGSAPAARAVRYALPFLTRAEKVMILVAGVAPDTVGTPFLVRMLGRHGIAATVETMDPGACSSWGPTGTEGCPISWGSAAPRPR
jgi:thiamine pyrophosphate-dependent acetolactate synthase large subunit-like protein